MLLRESLKSGDSDWPEINCGSSSPGIVENPVYAAETQNTRCGPKARFAALDTYAHVRLEEDNGQIHYFCRKLFRPPDLLESLVIHYTWQDLISSLVDAASLDSILIAQAGT